MFTIIPSLYIIGVHYFRQWNSSYHHEEHIKCEIIPKTSIVQIPKKKPHHRRRQRRKTSISELSHDDIVYLMKETSFTEEKILLWYTDYLVRINLLINQKKNLSFFLFVRLSVIVQMENFLK